MKNILKLALLLLPMTALAQPPVGLYGPAGSKGNFPFIYSPPVIFTSDADHTMVYPEMSGDAGPLIVTTGTGITLTATRNVNAPNTGAFTWPVKNTTAGGQTINFRVQGVGSSVPVPNGQTVPVVCDPVNGCVVSSDPAALTAVTGTAPVNCTTTGSSVNCGAPTSVVTNPTVSQVIQQPTETQFGITQNGMVDGTVTGFFGIPWYLYQPTEFDNIFTQFNGSGTRVTGPVRVNAPISSTSPMSTNGSFESLSGVHSLGGLAAGNTTVTTSQAITSGIGGETYLCNATAGAVTLTLPDATTALVSIGGDFTSYPTPATPTAAVTQAATKTYQTGQFYILKKTDASANTCAFTAAAGQTIDGAASVSLTAQNQTITIQSNGYGNSGTTPYIPATGWSVIGTNLPNAVTGPGSPTSNDAATFTGTGDAVQDSGVPIYLSAGYSISIGRGIPAASTGGQNISLGVNSLNNNTTGASNVALGTSDLYWNTTGSSNTAGGVSALSDNTTGGENTAFGVFAGDNSSALTNNSYSTFFGYHANTSVNNLTNVTVIGNGAQATASNTAVVGNSSVTDAYFGSTSGASMLHAAGLNTVSYPVGYSQYALLTAPTTTSVGSLLPSSWTTGQQLLAGYLPLGSPIAPSIINANTLSVSYAATAGSTTYALNVQCYASDTCPTDSIWQAPVTAVSDPVLTATLNAGDTTMQIATLAGMPLTGHVVSAVREEIGYTFDHTSGGNSIYNITRGHHGTTATTVPLGTPELDIVTSESANCSTCGVNWESAGGRTSFGQQLNPGLGPNVLGDYGIFRIASLTQYAGNGGEFYKVGPSGGAIVNSGYSAASFATAAQGTKADNVGAVTGAIKSNGSATFGQAACGDLSDGASGCSTAVGNWAGLNYPPWTTGTPFVKMTAAGTFGLDTNTYLTGNQSITLSGVVSGSGTTSITTSAGSGYYMPTTSDESAWNGKFTLPSLTSGSVLFSNGSTIAQDNSNFFWDATNHRLAIGTTSPSAGLDVRTSTANAGIQVINSTQYLEPTSGAGALSIFNNYAGLNSTIAEFVDANSSAYTQLNIFPAAFSVTGIQARNYQSAAVASLSLNPNGGNVGIGTTNLSHLLEVNGTLASGTATLGASSTASNGSTQQAICLADGTGGCLSLSDTALQTMNGPLQIELANLLVAGGSITSQGADASLNANSGTAGSGETATNSGTLSLQGTYEDSGGGGSSNDKWTLQAIESSIPLGPSTLTFSHTGTSGTSSVSMPALSVAGSPVCTAATGCGASPTNHFTSNAFGVCYTNSTGLLVHVHITTISSPADTTTLYEGSCPSPSTPVAAQSQVGGSGEVSADIPSGVSYEATNDGSGTLVTWLEVY